MPAQNPDRRGQAAAGAARKTWPPAVASNNLSVASQLAEWVTEAQAAASATATGKTPAAHARKPLFRSRNQAYSKGDKILFASGIALSLVCAFFPWYVFLNQDQFGVRAVQLGDIPARSDAPAGVTPAARVDAPLPTDEVASQLQLDLFTTGTLPDASEEDAPGVKKQSEPRQQPFPTVDPPFSLVHVANGRAMFEDDSGLFVVQRNSILPDNSRVASIEQRDNRWVVVTSTGRVIELAK